MAGKLLENKVAQSMFDMASKVLGYSLTDLCAQGLLGVDVFGGLRVVGVARVAVPRPIGRLRVGTLLGVACR